MKENSIFTKIEKYLSQDSKGLLNLQVDSTILEMRYKVKQSNTNLEVRNHKLCLFVGTLINKPISKITDDEYKEFAEFINFCVQNKLMKYATLGEPSELQIKGSCTILKLYVFSDYTTLEFNDILQGLQKYHHYFAYHEGGFPLFEEVYKNVNGLNQSIFATIYENGAYEAYDKCR